jgi:hypothetical protein
MGHRWFCGCRDEAWDEANDPAIQDAEAQHFTTALASPIIRHLPVFRQPLLVTTISFFSTHSARMREIVTVFVHMGTLSR